VKALLYHVALRRDQMLAVREKLAHTKDCDEMAKWFLDIKRYGARRLFDSDRRMGQFPPTSFPHAAIMNISLRCQPCTTHLYSYSFHSVFSRSHHSAK
jgi:hypothetical protein